MALEAPYASWYNRPSGPGHSTRAECAVEMVMSEPFVVASTGVADRAQKGFPASHPASNQDVERRLTKERTNQRRETRDFTSGTLAAPG